MTNYKNLIFLLIILSSCTPDNNGFSTITENREELVDNKIQIVSQTVKTIRMPDRLIVAMRIRVFNYNNDIRIKYLTGLTKEDGLQDYLLDSIYYDKMGNDTLKKSFICRAKQWCPTQIFWKKFGKDHQVVFYMTERPFEKSSYYKRQIYYKYNTYGKILSETDCESRSNAQCDSLYKKVYTYDSSQKLKQKVTLIWKENKWEELEKHD